MSLQVLFNPKFIFWALAAAALYFVWGFIPNGTTRILPPELKVDVSTIEADRTAFYRGSSLWHGSRRSLTDQRTLDAIAIVHPIARKNFRKPLTLMGSHYASIALSHPAGSRGRIDNYKAAREYWVKAALLGDYYTMQILAINYRQYEPVELAEAATWSIVARHFSPQTDADFMDKAIIDSMCLLNSEAQTAVKARAEALVRNIAHNKFIYDDIVVADLEFVPR